MYKEIMEQQAYEGEGYVTRPRLFVEYRLVDDTAVDGSALITYGTSGLFVEVVLAGSIFHCTYK